MFITMKSLRSGSVKWGGETRPKGAMDKFTTSQPRQNTLY